MPRVMPVNRTTTESPTLTRTPSATRADTIPPEILRFLADGEGRSLSIRGQPGTGKSSLALEVMLRLPGRRFFVSTRVDNARLLQQFPFLASSYESTEVIDLSSMRSERLMMKSDAAAVRGLVEANSRPTTRVELDRFMVLPPPIQELYSRAPEGPGRATILIDSWEALVGDYASRVQKKFDESLTEGELAESLLSLFTSQGSNVILVRETADPNSVDYLVDGVIEARREIMERRVFRTLNLLKLRGVSVGSAEYPFTLHGGRFAHLRSSAGPSPGSLPSIAPGFVESTRSGCVPAAPEPLAPGFTWGHQQLQSVLPSLLPGNVVLLETKPSASGDVAGRINVMIAAGNEAAGIPQTIVLPEGFSPEILRKDVHPRGEYSESMRVVWGVSSDAPENIQGFDVPPSALHPFVLREGVSATKQEIVRAVVGPSAVPTVITLGLSMIHGMCGRDPHQTESVLGSIMQRVRKRGDLMVVDATEGAPGLQSLARGASVHIRVHERDGFHFLEVARLAGPLLAVVLPKEAGAYPLFEIKPIV